MEFMSRSNGHPAQQVPQQPVAHTVKTRRKHIDWVAKTVRFELFIVVIGVALILVAVSLWLATGNFTNAQAKQINNKEYQAVFLTNGQVYFGKIDTLNSKFISLTHVFYIENQNSSSTSTTATTSNNYTLRKLGVSELHAPEDKMVINGDQVSFWENLKDSSQVVTKIKEYYSNPSAANQSSSSSGTQGSSSTTTQSTTSTSKP
jgi:hypothetical protein